MNKTLDPNVRYYCSPVSSDSGFTRLMRLIVNDPDLDNDEPLDLNVIAQYIKEHPEEIDTLTSECDWSPIKLAARNGLTDVVELLIGAGAKVDPVNPDAYSALQLACMYCNTTSNLDTVKALIKGGAQINAIFAKKTVLQMAIQESSRFSNEIVTVLLLQGATIDREFALACEKCGDSCNLETVSILLTHLTNIQQSNLGNIVLDGFTEFIKRRRFYYYKKTLDIIGDAPYLQGCTTALEQFDRMVKLMIAMIAMETHDENLKNITAKIPQKYMKTFFQEFTEFVASMSNKETSNVHSTFQLLFNVANLSRLVHDYTILDKRVSDNILRQYNDCIRTNTYIAKYMTARTLSDFLHQRAFMKSVHDHMRDAFDAFYRHECALQSLRDKPLDAEVIIQLVERTEARKQEYFKTCDKFIMDKARANTIGVTPVTSVVNRQATDSILIPPGSQNVLSSEFSHTPENESESEEESESESESEEESESESESEEESESESEEESQNVLPHTLENDFTTL